MKEKYKRPGWDEYFMGIVEAVAKRATCDRGRAGCVITKDNEILSTGYVGAPPSMPHCDDVGHLIWEIIDEKGNKTKHCVRTSHAEVNAIGFAARRGVALEGATLYVKMEPCYSCAKLIVVAGIKRVVAKKRYHQAQKSRELFEKAGVQLDVLEDELETYENM